MSETPPGMAVLYDATRLIARRRAPVPTGIDRVDLRYAQQAVVGRWGEARLVAQVQDTLVAVPRPLGRRLIADLTERWQNGGPGADLDPPLREAGMIGQDPPRDRIAAGQAELRLFALRNASAFYLNTSHHGIGNPELFLPLSGRLGAGFVFLVHDLIPIEFPEYVRPGDREIHAQRMRVVAGLGSLVIANSAATRRSFEAWAEAEGLVAPPVTVAHLGAEPAFLARQAASPPIDRPYFVCVGTIEPRKNHITLLHMWRAFARDLPAEKVPLLVVIGRRGWECAHVTALLDRCEALRPHVIELSSLSDHEMLAWLAGGRALLFPSFSEGWGLPVVEALAQRVPVLCSDLPVLKEASQGLAERLDPLDAAAWSARILALATDGEEARTVRRAALSVFTPPAWEAHFATVDRAFADLAARGASCRVLPPKSPLAPTPDPAPEEPEDAPVFADFGAAAAAGDAARDLRQWALAAAAYRAATRFAPGQAAIWIQLGHMLKEAGNLAGAQDAYGEALRLAPEDADLHLQLGHLLKVANRLRDAGAWYEAALALDPTNRDAAEHAAWVQRRLGEVVA